MTLIAITYIAVLGLGIVWIIYRLAAYIRAEREREGTISAQMFADSQVESYLSGLKASEKGNEPAEPQPEVKSVEEESTPRD